jgi:hypothetical protein
VPEFWPEFGISKEQVFIQRENKFSMLTFQNKNLLLIKLTQIFCDVDDFCRGILCKMEAVLIGWDIDDEGRKVDSAERQGAGSQAAQCRRANDKR